MNKGHKTHIILCILNKYDFNDIYMGSFLQIILFLFQQTAEIIVTRIFISLLFLYEAMIHKYN